MNMTEPKHLKDAKGLSNVLATGGGISYLKSVDGLVTIETRNGSVHTIDPRTIGNLYHSAMDDEETIAGRTGIGAIIPLIGLESAKREKRPYYNV